MRECKVCGEIKQIHGKNMCSKCYMEDYKAKFPDKRKETCIKSYKKRREHVLRKSREYRHKKFSEQPWLKTKDRIRVRCSKFGAYSRRGILNKITGNELKELWFRDKAYNMDNPSIDRRNTYGDYTKENCRYMELSENKARRRIGKRTGQRLV